MNTRWSQKKISEIFCLFVLIINQGKVKTLGCLWSIYIYSYQLVHLQRYLIHWDTMYCTRKTFFKIFLNEYLFTAYQVVGCYQFLNPHIAKYYCAIKYFFKWMLSLSPEWSTLNSLELKINSIFIAIIRMLGSIRVDQDLDLWNNMSTKFELYILHMSICENV